MKELEPGLCDLINRQTNQNHQPDWSDADHSTNTPWRTTPDAESYSKRVIKIMPADSRPC